MPPTIDNPERDGQSRDDADWARWEQMFRDARPVLPEAAMARIEASVRRETARLATARSPRKFWPVGIVLLLILIAGGSIWALKHKWTSMVPPAAGPAVSSAPIEDRYPLEVDIGPRLFAPDRPLIRLDADADLRSTADVQAAPATQASAREYEILHAAERLPPDGLHALAVLEMRRVLGVTAPLPVASEPGVEAFHVGVCWRMLPLETKSLADFSAQLDQVSGQSSQQSDFWTDVFRACLAEKRGTTPPRSIRGEPVDFPGHSADLARFDVLVELGRPKAQAALDVLSTRDDRSLEAIKLDYPALRVDPQLYLHASRDLAERMHVLSLLHRDDEARQLAAAAKKLRYLNDPQDMAILIARLGPTNAWEKLLRPLMENEVAFIENPPAFDEAEARAGEDAIVRAVSKQVQEGVTTYTGQPMKIDAGPWRITCNKLSVFRNGNNPPTLSGEGNVRIAGVIGIFSATANEFSFNTETGELTLSSHIHLDGWDQSNDVASCLINRTGEVRSSRQ